MVLSPFSMEQVSAAESYAEALVLCPHAPEALLSLAFCLARVSGLPAAATLLHDAVQWSPLPSAMCHQGCEECERAVGLGAAARCQLALAKLLAGGAVEACWQLLRPQGLRLCLAPCLFQPLPHADEALQTGPQPARSADAPVVVLDGCAADLLAPLQAAFAAEAPFWAEHRYADPMSPYTSYAYNLADAPLALPELLAQRLLAALRPRFPALAGAAAVEWWGHRRGACEGHHLHYDADEQLLARSGRALHPVVSTVLLLSAPAGCGETVVIEQRLGAGVPADGGRAWRIPPRAGRLAAFEGDLLHGVLPSGGTWWDPAPPGAARAPQPGGGPLAAAAAVRSAAGSGQSNRITLMVAFYGSGLSSGSADAATGPLRQAPWRVDQPPAAAASGQRWRTDMEAADMAAASRGSGVATPASMLVPCPAQAPAWVAIPGLGDHVGRCGADDAAGLASAVGEPAPLLRFFLRGRYDFEELYHSPIIRAGG